MHLPRHQRSLPLAAALLLVPLTALFAQTPPPPAGPPEDESKPETFGAIAFTADGSFASAWKWQSKEAVEARVLSQCNRFKRGHCEVATVRDGLCASIASFSRGMQSVTYAGAGVTPDDARRVALRRCNGDRRSGGKCQIRTTVCSDRKG